MITQESIQEKIGKLKIEQATLQTLHERMVQEFQQAQNEFNQKVVANQNRFQQITGGIVQLMELLNSLKPEQPPEKTA